MSMREFAMTAMGQKFFNVSVPSISKELKALTEAVTALTDCISNLHAEPTKAAPITKVELGSGYLYIEPKGTVGDYPGVYLYFNEVDEFESARMVSCVEESTPDGRILTESYSLDADEPIHIFNNTTGEDER